MNLNTTGLPPLTQRQEHWRDAAIIADREGNPVAAGFFHPPAQPPPTQRAPLHPTPRERAPAVAGGFSPLLGRPRPPGRPASAGPAGELDRAVVAFREAPSNGNRERVMAAMREHTADFHAEQTANFQARTA